MPLSFVVCVSDESVLRASLLGSPCLGRGSAHQVIAIKNAPSAAHGLNLGLDQARHELVVCIHQDVCLPGRWDQRLVEQYREAEARFGPVGVAGVYGVGEVEPAHTPGTVPTARRLGRLFHRGRLLCDGPQLPAPAVTLDEVLLVLPRRTPLRFDPELGFHLYGSDLCLQARERGHAVVVLDALCHHNSRSAGLPEPFLASAEAFARKWRHRLPIATPCVLLDSDGSMCLLGNPATSSGVAHASASRGADKGTGADGADKGRESLC